MRPLVDWMTKSDPAILELLDESGIALPPTVIAFNVDGVSRPTVQRRVKELAKEGLIRKVSDEKGYYEITDRGRAYLAGDLDAEDLERASG